MDKQFKSYAQLYSGNWNHGGLLRSWPDDIAGSTTASRSKGHRLFLRQALHSSLSVILDERMFYVGSDDEEGERRQCKYLTVRLFSLSVRLSVCLSVCLSV